MKRRLGFSLGVSILPCLGGCAVAVAWDRVADGTAAGQAMGELLGGGFALLPVVVFLLVLAGTYLAETRRFEDWFSNRFAVGFGVLVLALFTPMALGAMLHGEWGFGFAALFVMFSGYPLFAFSAGAILTWKHTPALDTAIPQLTNRP